MRELAREKARAAKKKEEKPDNQADQSTSRYRDRASERRTLFNQPDAPLPEGGTQSKAGSGKRSAEGPPPAPSPPPPGPAPGKDETNIGNKLLKMMGWTEGTGLGTGGEGRIDPM